MYIVKGPELLLTDKSPPNTPIEYATLIWALVVCAIKQMTSMIKVFFKR